jgi:CelD/BcsL family acetyltransferase involved in cellulose biosynthesis
VSSISLTRVTDFAALGERWRDLEARSDGSFFQSWTWTGCLVEERFPDPVLLEATDAGRTVALALFNRRRGLLRQTLFLGETGNPAWDALYVEHNGILLDRRTQDLLPACLIAAREQGIDGTAPWLRRRLVLSGIGEATLNAARASGRVSVRRSSLAPAVELARVRDGGGYLAGLSANTRYQVRRSDRAYAAIGTLSVARAATVADAHAWLDELAALHQAAWRARGRPGAFAQRCFGRFHHALIDRGMVHNAIDLMRITAGSRVVGLLYNFRYRNNTLAYQSGFDYAGAGKHQKPGLTCHHQAILFAAGAGLKWYDFLAGEARYKASLASGGDQLHWLAVLPACPLAGFTRGTGF